MHYGGCQSVRMVLSFRVCRLFFFIPSTQRRILYGLNECSRRQSFHVEPLASPLCSFVILYGLRVLLSRCRRSRRCRAMAAISYTQLSSGADAWQIKFWLKSKTA